MKYVRKLRLELLFLLLAAFLCLLLSYWQDNRPSSYAMQAVLLVLCIADALALYRLFIIIRRKRRDQIAFALKRLFAKAALLLMKLLDRWQTVKNFITGSGKYTLSGKTSVTFDFTAETRKQKPPKPPKWKNMQTGRQKLGYLYYHLITRRMKRGMPARAADTPAELKTRAVNQPAEERLFDLYIGARYDERVPLEETELLELKESLFGKKKKDEKKGL